MPSIPAADNLDSSIWTVSDVLAGLRVRDLKRRLQLTHGYTVAQLDRLQFKSDLIDAIIKEETNPAAKNAKIAAAERVKNFFPGLGDEYFSLIVTAVVVVVLVVMDFTLEGGGPISAFIILPFQAYVAERKQIYKRVSKASFLALLLLGVLVALDLLSTWIRATVVVGWVLPRSIYYRIYPFLFPMPNLRISTSMLMPAGGGGGGGGGYGINIFPIISGKIIGWIESRVKEGIAMAVERGESAGMGAGGGGGGEKKKKKKRRPVVYEDDID
ncbi:hypothetical protein TrST_g10323 [Triparma strigata]|uniref:Uncharacterized protein n=1 Tax=Triparma strigata TaxID=1606541 RepID=A0A9W7AVM8_9STRA|nr:hypothetical protein TrST_g10323 [Triparma strigata]